MAGDRPSLKADVDHEGRRSIASAIAFTMMDAASMIDRRPSHASHQQSPTTILAPVLNECFELDASTHSVETDLVWPARCVLLDPGGFHFGGPPPRTAPRYPAASRR